MTDRLRGAILIVVTIAVFAAVFIFVQPSAQPQDYHDFADARTFFGIPRAWDTVSYLGFLVVGAMGLKFVVIPMILGSIRRDTLVCAISASLRSATSPRRCSKVLLLVFSVNSVPPW